MSNWITKLKKEQNELDLLIELANDFEKGIELECYLQERELVEGLQRRGLVKIQSEYEWYTIVEITQKGFEWVKSNNPDD